MVWWNTNYPFRRKIQITAPSSVVPINHPVTITLPKANLVDMGKMKSDYTDLAVVYNNTQIGRQATLIGSNISVEFKLQTALTADQVVATDYYIYYGAISPVAQPAYTTTPWPISVNYDGVGVSYTRPGEDWVDGTSDVRYARATFIFSGSKVRIIGDLGKSNGIAEVQMDDGVFVDVDLYNRATTVLQTLYERDDLTESDHVLRVRVSGRQNAGSSGTKINIVRFDYRKNVAVIDTGEEINDFTWSSSLGGGA